MSAFIPAIPADRCEFLKLRMRQLDRACPHCVRRGFLKAHGILHKRFSGSAPAALRVFCSNRGANAGCGRTFSIHVPQSIPGSTITADSLERIIRAAASASRQDSLASVLRSLPLTCSPSTARRWLDKFHLLTPEIRTRLCRLAAPPQQEFDGAILRTWLHFETAFPNQVGRIAAYQLAAQATFSRIPTRTRWANFHRSDSSDSDDVPAATRSGKAPRRPSPTQRNELAVNWLSTPRRRRSGSNLAKRRPALLGSNRPRDSQEETTGDGCAIKQQERVRFEAGHALQSDSSG